MNEQNIFGFQFPQTDWNIVLLLILILHIMLMLMFTEYSCLEI